MSSPYRIRFITISPCITTAICWQRWRPHKRAHLLKSLGYIVDNPQVGKLLAEHYWAPGNSASLDQTLISLTGEALNPRYLAAECNRSGEDAWRLAHDAIERSGQASAPESDGIDASIAIVHGAQHVASNAVSLAAMYTAFETWIENSAVPATQPAENRRNAARH